jgi:hypothetical protein
MATISERAVGVAAMPAREQAEHRGRKLLVTEEEVGDALRWLATNAAEIGEARAAMIRGDRLVQHTEALLMQMSEARSADARKAEARSSQRWLDATEIEATAAGEFEKMRALREAAMARIEAWRTESASNRSSAR